MYAGPCELNVPTSGTRDRRLRGYLVSFARCPRVETDLAAAVSLFHFEFRSIDFLYIFPCQSIRLTQTESQQPDGGVIRNLSRRPDGWRRLEITLDLFFKSYKQANFVSNKCQEQVMSKLTLQAAPLLSLLSLLSPSSYLLL